MIKPLLTAFLAGIYISSQAQQFSLLKDINPGTGSSNVCYLTDVNNNLFFAATNGVHGMELWKSDGTEAGTVMIKDIRPGSANSSIGYLTNINGTLYFVANNGSAGTELWKSDGTAAGTVMVKDIRTGLLGSNPTGLVNLNGTLYFAADNGLHGMELWKSDGTSAGTSLVKDINALTAGSYPQALAGVNGTLFFAADNGMDGMELWKSDGTVAGTVMVKEIFPGSDGGYPYGLIGVGATLFFAAGDGINGTELWKSDGTSAGTTIVKDIWAGSGDSYPFSLKSVDGQLFFSADNGTKGDELWKSDGTGSGTTMVKDIWPGIQSGAAGNFSQLINKLLFTGNDGISGYTTWQSDGSPEGTKVATIGAPGSMLELVETDTVIFASITQTDVGRELWVVNYSSVLPLCILEFKGWITDDDAILSWKTDQESNTDKFIVERSINGMQYSPVGSVTSANTPGVHNYAFTDDNINSLGTDIVYYRLKQIDIDGHYTYSKIVTLPLRSKGRLMLYPNPATTQVNLTLSVKRKEKLHYHVYDNAGRMILQQSTDVLAGVNSLPLDIGKLSSGVYYLSLFSNSLYERLQFVKR